MRIKALSLSIACVVSTGLMSSAAADPVSLLDYEEVNSSYQDAYVSGSFNSNSGNQDQASYDLDLAVDYEKAYSSPDRKTTFQFTGVGSTERGPNEGDDSTSNYLANGSATVDNYIVPGSRGLFWFGKGDLGVKKDMEEPFTKLTAGVGFGRVVNVTPMAKAMRLVSELRTRGILTRYPAKEHYQRIAAIIDKETEYRSKYGARDYKQNWIAAIESVLKDSGAVKGGGDLGALAILKTHDILVDERITTRKHGWLGRAGVGYVVSDYDGDAGEPALDLGFEYHHPISNQTQFSNVAAISTVLESDNDGYNVSNNMSLTHEISDRVDWENKWLLNYNKGSSGEEETTNSLSSSFNYHLSNQLDFTVTGKLEHLDDNMDDNGNDDLDKSLNLGVKYRLK